MSKSTGLKVKVEKETSVNKNIQVRVAYHNDQWSSVRLKNIRDLKLLRLEINKYLARNHKSNTAHNGKV